MKVAMKIFIYFIIFAVIVYLGLLLYLYFNQRNLVFFPMSDIVVTPADANIPFEDLNIKVDDSVTINGWFVPADSTPTDKVVLFCHGNAGNISHRINTVDLFYKLGVDAIYFDYRGYGRSTGSVSEDGVYADAQAVFDWLVTKNYQPSNIYVMGRSLGGAVAVDLASKNKIAGLIVESTFSSAIEVGQKTFPIIPIKALLKDRFESDKKIIKINCPKLFIHSKEDDIIPYSLGYKLFETANEPKEFFEIEGRHNDRTYLENSSYLDKIRTFLNLN